MNTFNLRAINKVEPCPSVRREIFLVFVSFYYFWFSFAVGGGGVVSFVFFLLLLLFSPFGVNLMKLCQVPELFITRPI